MQETLRNSIEVKRIHHQLLPMRIEAEAGFDAKIMNGLHMKGHKIKQETGVTGFSAITGISKVHNILEASSDVRRNGSIAIS